jgi:DNA-directed RNA polymerase specialized sigma subunit
LTNQEKIQFLRQYRHILEKIEILQKDLIRWRELGEKVTPSLTGTLQGGQNVPKVEQSAINICDTQKEISERIRQLSSVYVQILSAIDTVDDISLQNLLHRRYIEGQTFERIAVEMHYSWRHVHRQHKQALSEIKLS